MAGPEFTQNLNDDPKLTGMDILVLGAGRSGQAACRLLHALGAHITLVDDHKSRDEIAQSLQLPDIAILAGDYNAAKQRATMLVLSPGIPDTHPLVASFLARDIPVLSEIEIAGRFTSAPIIAVTGSNGKSTVTSMIHEMMAAGGFRSFLGGNIGIPFTDNILEEQRLKPATPVQVVEVSSFQAEHLVHFKPTLAVFLNLSPDHLDRYSDLESYGHAKLQLVKNMDDNGWIVYNQDDPFFCTAFEDRITASPFGSARDRAALFSIEDDWIFHRGEQFVSLSEIILPGRHNVVNFLAAATAARLMGVEAESLALVMRRFKGLPHRLERVAEIEGVQYYNDSKATNVASTRVALASFPGHIILILGGSDKGATDYPQLSELIREKTTHLVTYGQAGLRLTEIFQGQVPIRYERDFRAAVDQAREISQPGDTVLLAPACASFDQFANFEERGDTFRTIVHSYRQETNHA
jgi:UDP-N-acetylmuramoylalanine--D-glutamate ligase